MKKYIKLSDYAKMMGIHYQTAWTHWKKGKIKGFQDEDTLTIYVQDNNNFELDNQQTKAILYARVSSTTNKASLDGQIERMKQYASAKGYVVIEEHKEIASGLNENRKQLNALLNRHDYNVLIVEHKDRLTRFGASYIEQALNNNNVSLEIINQTEKKDNELVDDFVAIVTSFCGRIYGRKRKERTEEIIKTLNIKKE